MFDTFNPIGEITKSTCQHEWQHLFTDKDNFENYRCKFCPYGMRTDDTETIEKYPPLKRQPKKDN